MRNTTHRLLLFLLLLAPWTRAAAQQTPSIEYSSFLEALQIYSQNRRLGLGDIYGAFFPEESIYRGQAGGAALKTDFVIRDANGREVFRNPRTVNPHHSVFTRITSSGTAIDYTFEQPGKFTASIELDGRVVGELPFEVKIQDSGDPFNPVRIGTVEGPWKELAYISLPRKGDPNGTPDFCFWARGGLFNEGQKVEIKLRIRHDGDTVYEANPTFIAGHEGAEKWTLYRAGIQFMKPDGGGRAPLKEIVKKDGAYDAVLYRNEEPWKLFRFQIAGGRLVPHPRQKFGYQPHADYLVARNPIGMETNASDLIWMVAEGGDAASNAASAGPAAVAGPSPAMLARWTVKPTSPAGRKPALKLTGIAARMDAGLAVGDDVIAFATGSIKGVSYIKVGEDVERTLPGGQDFHSKHFFVCGKKIVMLRGSQVVVFDTETETLHEVPETDVTVSKAFLDNYKGNAIDADGYLVAVLCDPKKVDDRVIAKVIDVSGQAPEVISLKNPEVPVKDVEAITVDAETGKVAMGSYRQKALYVADVAPRAVFERLDLSSIDGIARETAPMIAGDWLAYFDGSGSQPKFRLIELSTKRTQTLPSLGKAYRCYDLTPDRLAFATTQSYGSEYAIGIGTPGGSAKLPDGAGDKIPETAGTRGLGSSIAITGNLTFIAGQGKSGIGSGEYLQASDGSSWRVIAGPDGKPLPGVDVVASDRVLAFKTGSRNDTTVGYIVLGSGSSLAQLPGQ